LAHRVVVTGLGLVTPVGTDVDSTWTALLAGTPGAAPITKFDPRKLSVRFACEVKGFDPLKYIDRKEARRYDLFAQFALAAAHQAVTQAGLEGKFPSPERTGVIIGSGIGGMQTYAEQLSSYVCIPTSRPAWSPSATVSRAPTTPPSPPAPRRRTPSATRFT